MYFTNFNKIDYPFVNPDGTVKTINIIDISKNVRIRKLMEANVTTFEDYTIQNDDTPEIVSEKLYGSPYYHWVLMLVNFKFHYLNDFPISSKSLFKYVTDTYGSGKEYDTHHYEQTINDIRLIIDPPEEVIKPIDENSPTYQEDLQNYNLYIDFISNHRVTNLDHETFLNDEKRKIKVIPKVVIDSIIQEMNAL
jgi:hypothetical protein